MKQVTDFASPATLDVPGRARSSFPEITDPAFWSAYEIASPFSMVHVTGFYNVYQSLDYIARNQIPGCLVECGCFLGGIGIFMGLLREQFRLGDRRIRLFDTFEGFPDDGEVETTLDGTTLRAASMPNMRQDVEDNIRSVLPGMPGFDIIEGPVERTLPTASVDAIALLRLDTDFYSSTRAEFEHLYPKLVRGGVLIVDDYGFFHGARRATDEYLRSLGVPPLLNRIDATVWAGVKP